MTKALLLIVLVFTMFNLYAVPVSLGQSTELSVVAPTTEIMVPTRFNINITVVNVPAEPNALFTWQIKLYYNTSVLTYVNATLPPGHVFDGKMYFTGGPINSSDALGTYILYTAALSGTEPQRFTGNGTLCQISFEAKAAGTSTLTFSRPLGSAGDTWLVNFDFEDISFATVDGTVTVAGSDIREPSAISLMVDPTSVVAGANVTIGGAINVTVVDGTPVYIEYSFGNSSIWLPLGTAYTVSSVYSYTWVTSYEEDWPWDIRARWEGNTAYKPAISETKTVVVTPDLAPPTTLHDYDGLWHNSEFFINLRAVDDFSGVAEIYYKINGSPIKNITAHGQPLITTESAENKLEYWSVDKAGNEEIPHNVLTGIKLDVTSPTGSILINNDDVNTNTRNVTLNLWASDDTSGVSQMRLSNDGTNWTTWETYTTSKVWNLSLGEGTKTVYAQYKDIADLVSPSYNDTITLTDVNSPTTAFSLSGTEGNSGWFTSNVKVTLSATDDISSVDKTEYSFDNSTWIIYETPFNITSEGSIIVYYKSTDKAGNVETTKIQTIKIDQTAPSGSIVINNDDAYTTSISVTLTLTETDIVSGVYEVRYSNDGVWDTEPWENPSSTKAWTLTSGDGTKIVHYQIKDTAGLLSRPYNATIILDTLPPSVTITSPTNGSGIRSSTVAVKWNGMDESSGMDHYEIRLDGGSWANVGTNTTHTFIGLGDGEHHIEVKAVDKVGMAKLSSVYFTVNTSPLFGPGYIEEAIILAATLLVVVGIALYFLKIRKRQPRTHFSFYGFFYIGHLSVSADTRF